MGWAGCCCWCARPLHRSGLLDGAGCGACGLPAACRHSSGQLTCSKLIRGGLFHGGHVDPCPAPVCAVQCARVGGPLGKHRTSAPLVAADQRARQRTRREARSSQSGRRSRPGQTEGKSKRRRKEPLEAHGRPGTQLSLWMLPPGLQARPGRPLAAFFVPHNSSFGRLPF